MNTTTAIRDIPLELDDGSIDLGELSMAALKREISLQKRPNALLIKMMNALEKKRQAKGYGWSRAWNKYGLNVFRTHTASMERDSDYAAPILPFIRDFVGSIDGPYHGFIEDLLGDPQCMLFTFYHNNETDGRQYEGITLSLGRKVEHDKSKRDRLDLIIEDARYEGGVDRNIDRVRAYICPWETYENKDFHLTERTEFADAQKEAAQRLYEHAVSYYHQWKDDEARQWSHWSTRYIDYFGPRKFIPQGSSFT